MRDSARLRFSVVVPAYNEEAYLGDTLRSLRGQDFPGAYEIVVVDNNSTDATAEIARSFGVRVVHEPAPGVCQARQRGLAEAYGDIIVSVDADTTYPPTWLSRIDASFQSGSDVVGVGGPCRYHHAAFWMSGFARSLFGLVTAVYRVTGWLIYITATNTAFQRTAFDGYDLNLTQGGDELDLLRRLRRRGQVVWDPKNEVATSPRRQSSGVLHTFFISFLVFYLGAYFVNRIAKRPVLGRAPVYRGERGRRRFRSVLAIALVVLVTTSLGVARYLRSSL